jgi:cysteine-rich repeat protein
MRRPTLVIVRLACALAGVLAAVPARAQLCGPTDDPCVVSASINVPSGSVFNLGTRDLVIAANKTLTVQGAGLMSVTAGDILLDDGARIVATGNTGVGGDVTLTASGTITLDPSSRIDVSSGSAGAIQLNAGSLVMNGQLRANATTRDGEGGFVSIQTTGNVTIGGTGILGSAGDRFGCGGFMDMVTDGSVSVTAPIEFKGGDCDGGDVDIDVLGDITFSAAAVVNVIATYEFGSGGSLSLVAGGDVTNNGQVHATGAGTLIEGGGDGGDLDVIATNVTIAGQVDLTGAGPDGSGGFVDISALGLLRLSAPLLVVGAQEGVGGDVLLASDGNVEANSTVDLRAGFAGGSFDVFAAGNFTTVSATTIDASGTGSPFGVFGGTVDVQACGITLPVGADVLLTGAGPFPRATARLSSSGTMTIGGTISAGAQVELRYRTTPPVFLPGFVISPAPIVTAVPALPCCIACGTTTTSSVTSTSTSSSTTSSLGGSTTTVSTASSSTVSTVSTTTSSSTSTTVPGACGAPMSGCRAPTQAFKAKLIVKDKTKDSADKIVWKWVRGQATAAGDFGDPLASDDYTLCLWSVAGTPSLIARVDAPAGGTCAGKACWRSSGRSSITGYKYVDSELTPNGAQKVVLASGPAGKAKAIVKAKGTSLTLPSLPLTLPVLVQLQGAGGCFETYLAASGVAKNTAEAFEGRASFPSTTTTTSTSSTSTTSPTPVCGNGARELPEECDDGNLVGGDCCSAACTAEPSGQACAEDGNVCTLDQCNGLGACTHPAGNAGLTCRPAADQCDAAEQCTGASAACPADLALPNGTGCDQSACLTGETCTAGDCGGGAPVACDACERCDETAGCIATPVEVCRQTIEPGKSTLLIKDQNPSDSDKIVWKWARGEETTLADLGTPALDDDYDVCLYDQTTLTTTLVARFEAPAAGACAGNVCWRPTSSGFKYVDPELTPDGIRKLLLKTGSSGKAAVTFKAKGANVPMPALPLGSVLRLQLQGNDQCWEATFSPGGVSQNDILGFKARSD